MGLFRRDEPPSRLPRKTRRAIDEISKALESLSRNASEEDLAISVDGLSLKSAMGDGSRLTAISRCQDEDSMAHIECIASIWSFMAKTLRERNRMQNSLWELTPRNPDSSRSDPQDAAEQVREHMSEALIKGLTLLENEIESHTREVQ